MEITRHFTATTYVVYQDKVLLHLHKKLNLWLPVGGHIDRDELPQEAAVREAKEESGLDIALHSPDVGVTMSDVQELIRPTHLLLENINQFHQHIDFIYYATASTFELTPDSGETENLRWLTREDISSLSCPDNVRVCALEALELLGVSQTSP